MLRLCIVTERAMRKMKARPEVRGEERKAGRGREVRNLQERNKRRTSNHTSNTEKGLS